MNKWLKGMAVFATFVMFLVMIAGSLVTKTESGLGCGNDWPLCNGKWVPEYTLESIIEYLHRVITGFAGIVVLVFCIWSVLAHRGNKEVLRTALFGFAFIIVESLLGAAAVIWPQSPEALALHFGFSLLAFTGVFLLTSYILQKDQRPQIVQQAVSKRFRLYTWGVTLYAYGVVYLGAYVRHTGASGGCTDWPLCNGEVVPELSGLTGIHFAHRVGAMILFLLIVGLFVASRQYKQTRRDIAKFGLIALLLVSTQVLSGGWVVLSRLHLYATLTHSAVITCLFGVLCYLCVQTLRQPQQTGTADRKSVV